MPYQPEITMEEHVVLGVLVTGQPQSVLELHGTLERRYGELLRLNVFELRAMLDRLEALGLIESWSERRGG